MQAILLQIVGLLIIVSLIIIFFSKEKIQTSETKIYSKLILLNLIFILVGIGTFIIAKTTNNLKLISIFQKVYMSILTLLNLYSIQYCLTLLDKENKFLKMKILLSIITGIAIILILILPLKVIYEGDLLDGEGLSYNIVVIHTIISFIFFFIVTIYLILRKEKIKKILPFIILIILYLIGFLIRKTYREIIFEGFFYSYILFIMFNTIENPDLKMLKEYIKNKEIVEKNIEEKSNMLFKISEDVRSPLRTIKLLSENITDSENIQTIHNDARKINSISNNTLNIVNDILDISTMDKQKIKVINSNYDIYTLFSQIVYIVKNKINKNIDFKYSISDIIPQSLYGDPSKIKQIICSLILNASNNLEKGTIDLDITSIVKYDTCRLLITISDTGKGLNLSVINSILESDENITEEELNKMDNLDINLKLIKKTIDILGGKLLIKSEENVGTTYTIVLNQLISSKNNNDQIEELAKILNNKKRVLIIDDDYKELKILTNELKKNNYEVISTMYGKDCIDRLMNKEEFDLIFIDDEMKMYNAVKVIDELVKLNLKNSNVIIMLNKDKEFIKEHYLEDFAFDDYLLKSNYKNEIIRIKEKFQ